MQEQAAKKSLGLLRDQRSPGSPGVARGLYSLLGQRESKSAEYDEGKNGIEERL